MPAEGMPHEPSMFAAPLAWISERALAAPRATILLGVMAAIVSVVYAVLCLGFRTSRLDLLNPQSEWNQRWLVYLEEFGDQDDAVIVIQGKNEAAVTAAIDGVAAELENDPENFSSVFHRVELERLRAKSLHLAPPEQIDQLEAFTGQTEPILRGDWQQLQLDSQLHRLAGALQHLPPEAPERVQVIELVQRLTAGLEAALGDQYVYCSPWPAPSNEAEHLADRYLLSDQGRLGMVLVRLVGTEEAAKADHHRSLTKLRELLPQVEARHPGVTIGVTGMPVLEHDEMHTSQRDMSWTGAVSAIGVGVCFWAAFGGWRHAALALAALLISICWAFAFVTGAVGHLNLLSVSFATVLIGQGIDFGIHYVAAYLRARRTADCLMALRQTSATVSPGIFTGGLTTAAAFCMTLLTDFTGLRELGLIAGGGILICTIGALVLLPPLIRLVDEGRASKPAPQIVPMHFLTWPMHLAPRVTIAMLLGFTVFCGIGLFNLKYDHNLLHLQSRGLPSVELEHTLIERADRSVWFALSMADTREELLARKKEFDEFASISHTEEIASLVPAQNAELAQVDNVRRVLALVPESAPQLASVDATVVTQSLRALADVTPECRRLAEALRNVGASETSLRLTRYQQQSAEELVARLQRLRACADPTPPTLADLPQPLTDRFIGKHGKYLLKVYAAGDVWDIEKLQQFVADAESVDPAITGHPIQTYYASSQMQRSYVHAGIYAFAAMLIAVIVDLRRVRATLIAIGPMVIGLVQTFGLLGWLGIPLNAANMIILPLIFGIGIDDGVHLLHDYFQQRGRYRLDNATFVAVLLTSVTTAVGFGSLVLSQHQGLRSLGQVLTLGVMCCLVSSTTLLPSLFVVWSSKPEEELEENPSTLPLERVDLAANVRIVPRRAG